MDIRTEFALKALKTKNFSELCREYGISTKSGCKWRNRLLQKSGVYGTGQAAFDVWREEFNTVRPHEALGMRTPAEVWTRSPRSCSGEAEQVSYEGMEVRRINRVGTLRFQGRSFQISMARTHSR